MLEDHHTAFNRLVRALFQAPCSSGCEVHACIFNDAYLKCIEISSYLTGYILAFCTLVIAGYQVSSTL